MAGIPSVPLTPSHSALEFPHKCRGVEQSGSSRRFESCPRYQYLEMKQVSRPCRWAWGNDDPALAGFFRGCAEGRPGPVLSKNSAVAKIGVLDTCGVREVGRV